MTDGYERYRCGGWRGVVLGSWRFSGSMDIDRWLAENPGETVVRHASREVLRVPADGGAVYVKRIRALTDAGLAGRDWGSFLKWVLRPSRALGAWRISCDLREHGFRCAAPLLAARRRSAWGYPEDLFVSREIRGEELAGRLAGLPPEGAETAALLRTTARQLAEFHACGYVHGDCLLRNLAISPEGRLVYLDNDRTRRARWYNPFRNKRRNLAQLGYSILRITNRRACLDDFLEEYVRAAGWPRGQERTHLVRDVVDRYLKRLRQAGTRKGHEEETR